MKHTMLLLAYTLFSFNAASAGSPREYARVHRVRQRFERGLRCV